MNCFTHPELTAIGGCKACYKGLCPGCATDTGNGLACSGCENEVLELNEMWERGKKIYGIGKYKSRIPASGVMIWALFSSVMWGVSLFSYLNTGKAEVFTITMAILFTIILGIAYYSSRRTGLNC